MTAFLLACVAALVVVNGFFVAAEFARVGARRKRVEAAVDAPAVRPALKQIDRIDEHLARTTRWAGSFSTASDASRRGSTPCLSMPRLARPNREGEPTGGDDHPAA